MRSLRLAGRRFRKDRRGAAALEFAIVAPVFLMLLFSIFEAGWFFFAGSAVEQATSNAARLIRTGQAQSATTPIGKAAFFDEVCRVVQLLGPCGSRLTVDVQRFDNFGQLAADLAAPVCRDASAASVAAIPYNAGGQRDIVRVRVCFLHQTINPALGLKLARTPDGLRKVYAVAIFRNEPFVP